jgi:hypothetical protein
LHFKSSSKKESLTPTRSPWSSAALRQKILWLSKSGVSVSNVTGQRNENHDLSPRKRPKLNYDAPGKLIYA